MRNPTLSRQMARRNRSIRARHAPKADPVPQPPAEYTAAGVIAFIVLLGFGVVALATVLPGWFWLLLLFGFLAVKLWGSPAGLYGAFRGTVAALRH